MNKLQETSNFKKYEIELNKLYGSWLVLAKGEVRSCESFCLCTKCNQTTRLVSNSRLKSGKSTSCGCTTKRIKVGESYGFWKVVEIKRERSLCECTSCGNTRLVLNRNLKVGRSSSCGCQTLNLQKQTNHKKYGADYFKQSIEHKDKISEIQQKQSETNLRRYGTKVASQNQNIKQKISHTKQQYSQVEIDQINLKREQTCIKKYGTSNISQTDWKKEKTIETTFARYGVTNYATLEESKQKAKNTNIEKYGVDNYFKCAAFRKKQIELGRRHELSTGESVAEFAKNNNKSSTTALQVYKRGGEELLRNYTTRSNIFSTEAAFIELMKKDFPNLQKFDRKIKQTNLSYRPDFKLEHNGRVLYINVDGLYYHSELGQRNFNQKYHFELREQFTQANYQIFQFREDEIFQSPQIVRSIILNYLGLNVTKYSARKTTLKKLPISLANQFLKANHLMNSYPHCSYYGLEIDNTLLCIMGVKTKGSGIEIVRFATKCNTSIRGGFSKLLHSVTQIYKPSFVESYLDLRYSTGSSYRALEFAETKKFLSWKWTDFKSTFNRLQCRANMDERHLTQKQYAQELGWHKIYDAGQALYRKVLT